MAVNQPPFATSVDLAARWRPISESEEIQADALLEDASQMILDEGFDVATIPEATLRRVVCGMVKRAMSSPGGYGVESIQQGAGPFQSTMKFSNPAGDLYLTKADRRALGGGRRQRAYEIDLLAEVEPYSELGWLP